MCVHNSKEPIVVHVHVHCIPVPKINSVNNYITMYLCPDFVNVLANTIKFSH